MLSLSSVPFLRITIALILGISIAILGQDYILSGSTESILGVVGMISLLLASFLGGNRQYSWLSGLALQVSFVLLGVFLGSHSRATSAEDFFMANGRNKAYKAFTLRLDDDLVEKHSAWRTSASVVSALDSSGQVYSASGKVLIYFSKKTWSQKPGLSYGDEIAIPNSVSRIPGAVFPQDFDFSAIMDKRGVGHQVFLDPHNWRKIGAGGNMVLHWAIKLRNHISSILYAHFAPRHAALLESLLLGYKENVDPEDYKGFAVSGTLHVLAVSGMHVGLLYMLLVLLFTGRLKGRKLPAYQGFAVIFILWAFVFLTGLSASVVRAAFMFSIAECGRSILHRDGSILNALFASAFLQLLISPMQLLDVGFQLSYLAVLGIVVIYPWLNSLWAPPGKALQFLYQSALVSLAATIATLPVTLYSFGNFPLWFLPANMLIVPFSTAIIFLALGTLLLLWMPLVSKLLIYLTSLACSGLLGTVKFFSALPYALLHRLQPDAIEAFFLFGMVAGATLYFAFKVRHSLMLAACSALLFSLKLNMNAYRNRNTSELVVCDIKGTMLAAVHEGPVITIYTLPLSGGKMDSLYQHIQAYCNTWDIARVEWRFLKGNMYRHRGIEFMGEYPISKVSLQNGNRTYGIVWDQFYRYQYLYSKNDLIAQKRHFYRKDSIQCKVHLLSNNYLQIDPDNGWISSKH